MSLMRKTLAGMAVVLVSGAAQAGLTTYAGNSTTEAAWRLAAGTTALETFESYATNSQLSELPALGIGFDTLSGGGAPNIYNHWDCCRTPYGSKQLANFPNGIGGPNQWSDIALNVLSGYEITALGFWNGDGQNATLTASIYDVSGNFIGSVGAFSGTFAGFVSDLAISRVVFGGNTGDGWNHLDGLQTNQVLAAPASSNVPEPSSIILLSLALAGLGATRRNRLKTR
jgi:hypothetical protein